MDASSIAAEMQRLMAMAKEAKDAPELRFQPTRSCPVGEAYMLNEIQRDERGQAYKVVLLNAADVPAMREAVRPHLHPLFGRMPQGLE